MLHLKHVEVVFNEGTADENIALSDFNLTLKHGEFVTIIGSNGAGKSTLMNTVSGEITPHTGEIMLGNRNITNIAEFKRSKFIGRVFQNPMSGTAPSMTIEENLAIAYSRVRPRTLNIALGQEKRALFKRQLKTLHLGLEDRLTTKVGNLSGGERQALSLLMATFTKPDILLLDEHTAALDPSRAEIIIKLTEEIIRKFQLTTLMVTHNMQQALDLGNRLIMMDKGKIILDVKDSEKEKLSIDKLLAEFAQISGKKITNDRALLQATH